MGRPTVPTDIRTLIRQMANANPRWGAPRIHGELLKLGIDVCQATVAKYLVRGRRPPSQTWRTFLRNHVGQIVAADFFVVPTATTVSYSCWCSSPTIGDASGTWRSPRIRRQRGQRREIFPWGETPRCLIHGREHAFAHSGPQRTR